MKVLAFSGLGSNEKDFSHLQIEGIQIDVVKRIPPRKNEKLVDYVKRAVSLTKKKEEDYQAILGFSFGGVLAQALGHHWNSTPIILISSFLSKSELVPISRKRFWGTFAQVMPAYAVPAIVSVGGMLYGKKSVSTIEHILETTSEDFLRWSVNKMARFKPFTPFQQDVHRIIASNDPFIYSHECSEAHIVKGGGHFILKSRKEEVKEFILNRINP